MSNTTSDHSSGQSDSYYPYEYDVFISHSEEDAKWVSGTLLPRLEAQGLKVCVSYRDFRLGGYRVDEIERAIFNSRFTLVILTPHYLKSNWTRFERLMRQTLDTDTQEYRLIPLVKEPCELPPSISSLIGVDFTNSQKEDSAWPQLLNALQPNGVPKPTKQAPQELVSTLAALPVADREQERNPTEADEIAAMEETESRPWMRCAIFTMLLAISVLGALTLAIVMMNPTREVDGTPSQAQQTSSPAESIVPDQAPTKPSDAEQTPSPAESIVRNQGLDKPSAIEQEPLPATRNISDTLLNKKFLFISSGEYHACGIMVDYLVGCWGRDDPGWTKHPEITFSQIDSGGFHTCGLELEDSTARCWGYNDKHQTDSPSDVFIQVTAGWKHSCGLRENGSVYCWGDREYGQTASQAGPFSQISAGTYDTCGIRKDDSSVYCWGRGYVPSPSEGQFSQISVSENYACGIRKDQDQSITCWGGGSGTLAAVSGGSYLQVYSGAAGICAVRTDSSIRCWEKKGMKAKEPSLSSLQVSVGKHHTCAIRRSDSLVVCLGVYKEPLPTPTP